MRSSTVYVVGLAINVVVQLTLADLPVHCLRHQVAGDWEFTLGPLAEKRSSCGHAKPDNPYAQPHMKFLTSAGPLSKRRMTLKDPNTVTAEDGSSGTWTMIYDEGFEVTVGGAVYFAFSKFAFTDADRQHNISHCDQTQIGWYHDATRTRWGCYVGKKVNAEVDAAQPAASPIVAVAHAPIMALQAFGSASTDANTVEEDIQKAASTDANTVEEDNHEDSHEERKNKRTEFLTTDANTVEKDNHEDNHEERKKKRTEILTSWLDSADQMAMQPDDASEAPTDVQQPQQATDDEFSQPPEYKPWVPSSAGFDKPIETNWQHSVATALNFMQLGWTASAYDQFQGKTHRELNRFAGVRRTRLQADKESHNDDQQESFTSFLGVASKVRHSSFEGEDKEFDWRKKDGQNWLTPVVTQGDCGSCYTISTVHMLTARNRIRTKNTAEPSFSVSFPLYCSEYNQGCDGGYGFLQSKWTEDVGLVPENCAPFSEGGGKCEVTPGCDLGSKRYRATGHHYVGGYYGGSDAHSIRKELVERGPVVMSFEPKEDFMYYKNGVYKSGGGKIHQEWEQVDHAVLLVGYGVDKDAYWTMQNSWGNDWGEDGYFRMLRGKDESGCESIVVSADVTHEESNPVLDDFLASL